MKILEIRDAGESETDRFTVIYDDKMPDYMKGGNGSPLYACVSMSANPFDPQGFCQHSCALLDNGDIGKLIEYEDLPSDCQQEAINDLREYERSELEAQAARETQKTIQDLRDKVTDLESDTEFWHGRSENLSQKNEWLRKDIAELKTIAQEKDKRIKELDYCLETKMAQYDKLERQLADQTKLLSKRATRQDNKG